MRNSSFLQTRSGRSNTFSTVVRPYDRTLRKPARNVDEDEPCCLKIQFMLAEVDPFFTFYESVF